MFAELFTDITLEQMIWMLADDVQSSVVRVTVHAPDMNMMDILDVFERKQIVFKLIDGDIMRGLR